VFYRLPKKLPQVFISKIIRCQTLAVCCCARYHQGNIPGVGSGNEGEPLSFGISCRWSEVITNGVDPQGEQASAETSSRSLPLVSGVLSSSIFVIRNLAYVFGWTPSRLYVDRTDRR